MDSFPKPNEHGVFVGDAGLSYGYVGTRVHAKMRVVQIGPEAWGWGYDYFVGGRGGACFPCIHDSAPTLEGAAVRAARVLVEALAPIAAGWPCTGGSVERVRREARRGIETILQCVGEPIASALVSRFVDEAEHG